MASIRGLLDRTSGLMRSASQRRVVSLAALGLLVMLLAAFGCGGPAECRQCSPTCRDESWPRLAVGVNSLADAGVVEGITFQFWNAKSATPIVYTPGPPGTEPNFCGCFAHVKDLVCTKTYYASPGEREVTVRVLRNGKEIGRCDVTLADHNYCGVDITSLQVVTDGVDQFECAPPTRFNLCN
jgi:hypothetical protein